MKKRPVRRRGFASGGEISSDSLGRSIMGGANFALGAAGTISKMNYMDALTKKLKHDAEGTGGETGNFDEGDPAGAARGGRIKRTVGPKIGKDDGLIPAQRGEYVVRRSAVKKLGTKALNTINKGKLPAKGMSRGR